MKQLITILFLTAFLISYGCSSTKEEKIHTEECTTLPNGLQLADINVGSGEMPHQGQEVTINYKMKVKDGKTIENTFEKNAPFTFKIGSTPVIKGLELGILTMRQGGKRTLIIPPDLAYGSRKVGDIPANSTLEVIVELIDIR